MPEIELDPIPLKHRIYVCQRCGIDFKVKRGVSKNSLPVFCSYSCRAKKVFTKALTPEAILRRDANRRLQTYKFNARSRDLPFELTYEEFAELIVKKCFYCEQAEGEYRGIDRLDSSLGYVKGNVQPCCFICNQMKRDYTMEDFLLKITQIANACGILLK
jgi:hypothetical protein